MTVSRPVRADMRIAGGENQALPKAADFANQLHSANGPSRPNASRPGGIAVVTLKEIAKAVGVSTATVSRVLNFDQSLSVAPHKRQAIIETAEAMKYETPRARNRADRGTPVRRRRPQSSSSTVER